MRDRDLVLIVLAFVLAGCPLGGSAMTALSAGRTTSAAPAVDPAVPAAPAAASTTPPTTPSTTPAAAPAISRSSRAALRRRLVVDLPGRCWIVAINTHCFCRNGVSNLGGMMGTQPGGTCN